MNIENTVIEIDRLRPFDPKIFIGEWDTIWHGPMDGDGLVGDEEQDVRSLIITRLDTSKLVGQTGFIDKEYSIYGEERRGRLLRSSIQLDAKICQALYEEDGWPTLNTLRTQFGVSWFEFLGTTFRDAFGRRFVLYLYYINNSWRWDCELLRHWHGGGRVALGLPLTYQQNV